MPPSADARTQRRAFAAATLLLILASPGQTYGVSVFVDPMLAELGLSRSGFSAAYTAATLCGAVTAPRVGRLLDDHGPSRVAPAAAALFALWLAACGQIQGLIGLTLGLAGLRVLGQGALLLSSNQAIAIWFRARRGTAMGLSIALSALGAAAWPSGVERLIGALGWRTAWAALAAVVAFGLLPALLVGLRDPADRRGEQATRGEEPESWTLAEARRTGAYWLLVASGMTGAGLVTGMGLHQISILAERGLSSAQAAATFAPHFLATAASTLLAGRALDRLDPRRAVGLGMGLMALSIVTLQALPGLAGAWTWAICLGVSLGVLRVTSGVALPRWFGLGHLGAIQGSFYRWFVASSALGAMPLALARDATGRYSEALWISALLPLGVAVASAIVRRPERG